MLIFYGIKCCERWEANERRRLLLSSRYSCGGSKYDTCQIRIQTQIQIQKLISTNTNEDLDKNTPPITVVLVGYTNGRHLSCLKCNSSPSTIYPLNLKCLPRSLNWKCIPFNCVCACICTWNKCYLAILSGKRQLYFPAIFRLPSSSDNRWGENLNNLTRKIETGRSLHCTQLYKCVPICTTYTSSNTSRAAMQMPLNNTSSDQSERSNTTARITQCHAATHTWALSSPGLSTNRDKQHEICADSALRGSGLLQDRTQGWVVSLHMSQFLTTGQKAFMSIIEIVET